ncbi:MAG: DNA repair protein RadC [Rikenellaceae bacterium]
MTNKLSIKQWQEEERPREKLRIKGAGALSDAELIAIILGSGSREETAVDIARNLISSNGNSLRELSKLPIERLTERKGIGSSKAIAIAAIFEIAKRFSSTEIKSLMQIQSSAYAVKIISPMLRDLSHEECWVMYLNRANKLISKERLSIGGVSATVVDVKIVIKNALEKLASSLILIHNHPSGNPKPGENDKVQTRLLKDAAALFDISLLDHLIIAGDEYFSFADDGIM